MTSISTPFSALPVAESDRQLPDSYWAATAGPQVVIEQLRGTMDADVVIVGGGFVGLRAALELAGRGVKVVVLDAEEPGWGASGRSGGQVNPLPHVLPDEVISSYGSHHAEIFFDAARGSADELFGLIRHHGIDCENYQKGWIQAAHTPEKMPVLEARQREWAKHGWDVEMVSRKDIVQMTGSPGFHGGALFKRGGAVHPLALTRGLAHVAVKAGARIFSKTRAETLTKVDRHWVVGCNGGTASIRCENVVLATNGYTGPHVVPKLKSTIVPLSTVQAASEPLSDEQLKSVMPGWTTLADTRRAIFYTRRTGTNRITLGALARNFGVVKDEDRNRIHIGVKQLFPQLTGLKWDYYWSGLVALTIEHLSHFHEPLPGVFAGLGFNGRGVAMSTVMGRVLAERILGADPKTLPFPTMPLKTDPYSTFGRWGLRLAVGYFEARDAVDNYRNREYLTKPV